jgi:hypothetical protein
MECSNVLWFFSLKKVTVINSKAMKMRSDRFPILTKIYIKMPIFWHVKQFRFIIFAGTPEQLPTSIFGVQVEYCLTIFRRVRKIAKSDY